MIYGNGKHKLKIDQTAAICRDTYRPQVMLIYLLNIFTQAVYMNVFKNEPVYMNISNNEAVYMNMFNNEAVY